MPRLTPVERFFRNLGYDDEYDSMGKSILYVQDVLAGLSVHARRQDPCQDVLGRLEWPKLFGGLHQWSQNSEAEAGYM